MCKKGILLVVFCIFLGTAFAETPSPYAIEKLPSHKAPDFTLKDINGAAVSLSSFKGKVVLLNFWATWCPPCREEIPSLDQLYRRLKGRGFVVLTVSLDGSASTVRNFIKETPMTFPVLMDEKREVTKSLYKVFAIPTTFLIDRNGVVVDKYYSEQEWTKPEFVKKVEALL